MVCVCGASVPLTSRVSICEGCLRGDDGPDEDYDGDADDYPEYDEDYDYPEYDDPLAYREEF